MRRCPGRGPDPVGEVEVEDGASSDAGDGKGRRSAVVAPKAAISVEGEALDPEGIGQRRGEGRGDRGVGGCAVVG